MNKNIHGEIIDPSPHNMNDSKIVKVAVDLPHAAKHLENLRENTAVLEPVICSLLQDDIEYFEDTQEELLFQTNDVSVIDTMDRYAHALLPDIDKVQRVLVGCGIPVAGGVEFIAARPVGKDTVVLDIAVPTNVTIYS